MLLLRRVEEIGELDASGFLITLGNFDGLHIGHRKIIEELVSRSRRAGGLAAVVTFDPHPRKVLNPSNPPVMITTLNHKIKLMSDLGVDVLLILRFDREFSRMSPDAFIRDYLFAGIRFREVIVGKNYFFGRDRKGDIGLLERLARELGFKIDFVEPVRLRGHFVSSSLVRGLISDGKFQEASSCLGRPYSIYGPVVKGSGRGVELGFPTANMDLDDLAHPAPGVFAVDVIVDGQARRGIANLGVRPTFEASARPLLEVHLLDFSGDLYGKFLEVMFKRRLRDEIRFESPDGLKRQIEKDIEEIRRLSRGI